jgi:hypothetical protein
MNTYGWHVASVPAHTLSIPMLNEHRGAWQVQERNWRPCMEWCVETFGGGIGARSWGPGWRYVSEGVFEFKNESDRLMFLLRWS